MELAEVARRAEALGYSALVFPDHFGPAFADPGNGDGVGSNETLRAHRSC